MLLDSDRTFLGKYSDCPNIQFELNEGKSMVTEDRSGKGEAELIDKRGNEFQVPETALINQSRCEIPLSREDNIMSYQHSLRSDANRLGQREMSPRYILQGEKFSPSRICSIGEIIGSEDIDGMVTDNVYQELFSMNGHSENNHELKALASEIDNVKHDNLQHNTLSNINFHSNFSFFGDVPQDSEPRITHPQSYQHQIRSSGLDKFTAVDRNGKRSILHEVETQAQLMPSIPGVYFDRRQIGYRVRYHNSYVGWVALSRHSSIKDAYEYAKQLWLKARNKSNMDQYQGEQMEVGAENSLGNRNIGVRKRNRQSSFDDSHQLNQKILCKSGIGHGSIAYFGNRNLESNQIFQSKYYNSECGPRNDYRTHPMIESEYHFPDDTISKQSFELSCSAELVKMSQYSALETMKKLYFATKKYIERWPSSDGYYTIHWSNTSDLSSYLYGEDCEYHKREFTTNKKSRNQRKIYFDSDKENYVQQERLGLGILNIENKKEIENFNYIW
ncbi:hypothetical protein OJ253_342 [Cryptosporidium canis]|uniref:Uncharacterized protein n=1 Tax=Cryptosporidium canis TaxID=195482 RepID=A0A9D5HYQ9_9CRYT|nr:hypothetical protein OJ253_342 [Cryptosporidium canis]